MFNRPNNPKTRHYIRILAGLYLLHLSWSLRAELRSPGLLMLACLLFAVVGAAFIVTAARVLLQKAEDSAEDVPPPDADRAGEEDNADPNDLDADDEDPDDPDSPERTEDEDTDVPEETDKEEEDE